MDMEEKMTVRELAIYYVGRYGLERGQSSLNEAAEDGLKKYVAELTEIMKNTDVDGQSLWDKIKIKGEARSITLENFEFYCFDRWAGYLIKSKCKGSHIDILAEDMGNVNLRDIYDADPEAWYAWDPGYTMEEVRRTGIDMMTEAIYHTLYDEFDWSGLLHDFKLKYSDYGDEMPDEVRKANKRLKTYESYIGNRKYDKRK